MLPLDLINRTPQVRDDIPTANAKHPATIFIIPEFFINVIKLSQFTAYGVVWLSCEPFQKSKFLWN